MRVSFVSQALIAVVWSTTAVNPERFRKIWRSFDASSVCSNGEAEEQSCTWPGQDFVFGPEDSGVIMSFPGIVFYK
eukprot:1357476-Amorphochlora_amoeboformis.AAC.2